MFVLFGRRNGGDLVKAAEWFSYHTGKHVVVLSDSLTRQLGGGGVSDAMDALTISPDKHEASARYIFPKSLHS